MTNSKDEIFDLGEDFEALEPLPELPELPGETEELPELPAATEELPELPAATEELPELPAATEELPELPAATEELPELPELAEGISATAPSKGASSTANATPMAAPAEISSILAWRGFGFVLAIGGVLSSWGDPSEAGLFRAIAFAAATWRFLTNGLGSVQPTRVNGKPISAALVTISGLAGSILSGFAIGPLMTLVGGSIAVFSPVLGGKKDKKKTLPPAKELDSQFSLSLAVYLLALGGMLLPWCGSGESGADSAFGAIVMVCILATVWSSWVGAWKLWTVPLVTGRLGILIFLAPMEIFILGLMGLLRPLGGKDDGGLFKLLHDAWPDGGVEESFLIYGAGPLLTFIAGILSLVILVLSAKSAVATAKERKEANVKARKASRASRKGNRKTKDKGESKTATPRKSRKK
ncbi:MAG TPA: hypothetical protein QGG59_03325 [Planctomycetota bacterium]|nr:hypothetical protein [Planctomycetota bacterium]